MNQSATNEVGIKVANTLFGKAQGPALIAFDQNASTRNAHIDLGDETTNSPGRNCFIGGANNPIIEATSLNVTAKSSWWGSPAGPSASEVSTTDAKIDTTSPLHAIPAACKAVK
jgi:hypothetical protein